MRLACLQSRAVREERGSRRAEVEVRRVVGGPDGRCEQLLLGQLRRELNDRVAPIVGTRRRPVAGRHPDVARTVDLWRRTSHPDGPLGPVRHGPRRVVVHDRATGLGHRDDPAVVRLAVPAVAPEPEHDVAVVEIQPGALQEIGGRVPRARRVHRHRRQLQGTGVDVQPDQEMGRRARSDELVGHGEDLPSGGVDDRGAGDPDVRPMSPHGSSSRRHRRPDVRRPQHRPGVGGQCVDGVVLRRHEDAPGRLERFPVDLAVEHRRPPGGRGRREGDRPTCRRRSRAGSRGRRSMTSSRRRGVRPFLPRCSPLPAWWRPQPRGRAAGRSQRCAAGDGPPRASRAAVHQRSVARGVSVPRVIGER